MRKYRVFGPRQLSDEEVASRKDFHDLLERYDGGTPGRMRNWLLGLPVLAAAAALAFMLFFRPGTDTVVVPGPVETVAKREVSPPMKDAGIAYTLWEADPAKDSEFTYTSGTRVKIPAHAFVDASGAEVSTRVDIAYREFHNPGQFMLSGIPMVFDSSAGEFQFISAGMFDIRMSSRGQEVFLREEARIEVEFASLVEGDDYGFYRFDEDKGHWVTLASAVGTEMRDEEQGTGQSSGASAAVSAETAIKTGKDEAPEAPRKMTDPRRVFRFQFDKDLFPELEDYASGYFEVLDEDFDERLFSLNWESASLDPPAGAGAAYKLHLGRKDTMIHLDVLPVLNDQEFDHAWAAYQEELSAYQARVDRRMQAGKVAMNERQRTAANMGPRTTRVTRSVGISAPGIYNFDKPFKLPELLAQAAEPVFLDADKQPVRVRMAYLIDKSINTYFTFFRMDEFRWNMENDNLVWVENAEGMLLQARYVPGMGEGRRNPVFIVDKVTDMKGLLELQKAFGTI